MIAPRGTTVDRDRLLAELSKASGSFGDGTGRWASVQTLAAALWVDYGRMRGELDRLADDGLVRRHPSGAGYWQRIAAPRA
jgi:hypothetical protein